ncbi:PREDICTED: global transcription regulator sge1-like [Eufriesea mexicana]|uniref:global transcription regulator sge1-like n=1 Tax=Eufriesea mexicana TaxID=516756 RepID=UPI00083C637B|nr:PREDICTED: global transcription regulator sge1-like [Eufriesea mexicana]
MRLPVLCLLFCIGLALAQHNQYPVTTPVPILKQINKHNEDGSYSYGYEAADGSYKIESKYPTGEVYGKYGFVDDTGSVREVEYGASRRGFEPAGPGINVAPPTLTGNSIANPNEPEDDGQYKEDPSVYYTDPRYTNGERYEPVPRQPLVHNQPRPIPAPIYNPPRYPTQVQYQPKPQYQPEYRPQYRSQYQPQYQGQQQRPAYPAAPIQSGIQGRPAPNADPNAGLASYTVNYRR